jgi:adenylosuccinate synthase
VIGVVKAYSSRVGEGPFPSELQGETADRLRKAGNEFGSITGRPRRIGWFDSVAVRYACATSGARELVVTNLDVLRGFSPLKIATAYPIDGKEVRHFPAFDLEQVKPVYEELPGFDVDITAVRSFERLPQQAQAYVKAIELHTGARVRTVSVGPGRDQVILR